MRPWHPLLLAAALLACGGDKDTGAPTGPNVDGDADTDADTDTDSDTDVDCESVITAVDPEPGATGVALDATVTVTFDVPVPGGGHWSLEVPPATGTATLAGDGLSATFVPDAELEPETVYDVEVEVCDQTDASSFTTAPAPIDVSDVEGNTYGLAWQDVTVTEPPPPGGPFLAELIPVDFVLLQIGSIDLKTKAIDAAATLAYYDDYKNVVPDCDVAVRETADFSANPYFQFGPQNIQIVINPDTGDTADIEDMELRAQVSADGTQLIDPYLSGLVATEQFLPGSDCKSAAVQSVFTPTCLPCTISPSGQCMLVEGEAAFANVQPGIDLYATCQL